MKITENDLFIGFSFFNTIGNGTEIIEIDQVMIKAKTYYGTYSYTKKDIVYSVNRDSYKLTQKTIKKILKNRLENDKKTLNTKGWKIGPLNKSQSESLIIYMNKIYNFNFPIKSYYVQNNKLHYFYFDGVKDFGIYKENALYKAFDYFNFSKLRQIDLVDLITETQIKTETDEKTRKIEPEFRREKAEAIRKSDCKRKIAVGRAPIGDRISAKFKKRGIRESEIIHVAIFC